MFRTLPILLALLGGGCHMADAHKSDAAPSYMSDWDGLSRDALVQVDTRGTAHSLHLLLQDVERAGMVEHAQTAEAMQVLSANCPWTRASFQLPYVLRAVVADLHAGDVDPVVREDLGYLKLGLDKHIAVLEALDVDLGAPGVGDYLRSKPSVLTLKDLSKAPDQTAAMQTYVDSIPTLAAEIDELTSGRLHDANGVAERLIGQPTLGRQLGGWENALRRIEPFASKPETRAKIQALVGLLQSWGGQGC